MDKNQVFKLGGSISSGITGGVGFASGAEITQKTMSRDQLNKILFDIYKQDMGVISNANKKETQK